MAIFDDISRPITTDFVKNRGYDWMHGIIIDEEPGDVRQTGYKAGYKYVKSIYPYEITYYPIKMIITGVKYGLNNECITVIKSKKYMVETEEDFNLSEQAIINELKYGVF